MSPRPPQNEHGMLGLLIAALAPSAVLLGLGAVVLLSSGEVRLGRVDRLWLLCLVPAVAAFFLWAARRKSVLLGRFASPEMLARILSGVSRPRQYLKVSLITTAVALAVLSLTDVQYGYTWEEVQRRGVDIVIALDVSDSMLVEDAEMGGKLTRLERAKREIADLLRMLEGDRIGLVAFAGDAFLECPLTLDYAAAEIFLDAIDTDLIPTKGTAIGLAVRKSLEAFGGGPGNDSRAIILITDGEDHSGETLAAAEEAKLAGVRIFPIGIGRDEGSPIPGPDGQLRRDRSGELILSKLDEPTLQKVALATGGRYVRSVTGDVDLEKIYLQGIKASLEDQELGSKRRQHWENRFQWLLGGAILLLALEPLVGERRRAAPASQPSPVPRESRS